MPTRETDGNASLGDATKQVAEHASSLARLELELAQLELKRKLASLGVGIGLGVLASLSLTRLLVSQIWGVPRNDHA